MFCCIQNGVDAVLELFIVSNGSDILLCQHTNSVTVFDEPIAVSKTQITCLIFKPFSASLWVSGSFFSLLLFDFFSAGMMKREN